MFTTNDVGKSIVNGAEVELSLAEKQAIVDEWNANLSETPEEIIARLESALDRHLDAVAKKHGYLDVTHILSYVDDENPVWDSEARAFKLFRSRFWKAAIAIENQAKNGEIPIPTESELIEALPKFDDFQA
jgi:hypothetical protein